MQDSLLFQTVVYISVAIALVAFAKKTGLGAVLGYLLAGIIIGPYVLKIIGDNTEEVMHFAEFGVVLMLFVIGLELEPKHLWKLRIPILGLGGLQVTLITLLVAAIGYGWGLTLKESIAVGMIVSLSSTAMVIQILNEKGLMNTQGGNSAFSVLLFQDIAVIPMLSILPLLADGDVVAVTTGHEGILDGLQGWLQTLIVLGIFSFLIFAGKYLIRPVLRLVAKTRVEELFTASALLIVCGSAFLMEIIGLSAALGAFVAGVLLATSEFKHELEGDIKPFKGLLLGLFFMAVGALINFDLILAKPLLIMSLVVAAMSLKAIIQLSLGAVFKLSKDQNLLFGLSLAQLGEFGFVLITFAMQHSVFRQEIGDVLLAVVSISMALTPFVMILNEKVLSRYIGTKMKDKGRPFDKVEESKRIIIAGFGRYGSIVGRFLRAHGIEATVLDANSDRVDVLRKMGIKVYYGDATRHELLASAGAAQAHYLIAALDDPTSNLELVEMVQKNWPHLKIFTRVNDYGDAYQMLDLNVPNIYRETLDSALRMGSDVLTNMGMRSYSSQRAARTFLKHEDLTIKKMVDKRHSQGEYILAAKERIEELESLLHADMEQLKGDYEEGWDSSSLKKEVLETGKLG